MPPSKHRKYSCSKANRWWNCPRSIQLCATVPALPTSDYAKEGTAAAALAEKCIEDMWGDPLQYIGKTFKDWEVDEEMAEAIDLYIDTIKEDYRIHGGHVVTETFFDMSLLHPELGGTCDAMIFGADGWLGVYDLKYGKGVSVSAVKNKQLLLYALGAIQEYKAKAIELCIIQPRIKPAIRRWAVPEGYMDLFEFDVLNAIRDCESDTAALNPGEWCKFCDASGICPALRQAAYQKALVEFTPHPVTPDPSTLTVEQLVSIDDAAYVIEHFAEAVHRELLNRAERGDTIPGRKLVTKYGREKWVDAEQAAEALALTVDKTKLYHEPKLKTPAQLRKLKINTEGLTEKPVIGKSLVYEDDNRPAELPSAKADFMET